VVGVSQRYRRVAALVAATLGASVLVAPAPGGAATETVRATLGVTWMAGYDAPGTPSQYNRVGVIKVGSRQARNVLVLEPGTSAGAAYFVPLAKWIVARAPSWQVWSVERRENLLEDQSVLNAFKAGRASATELFDYYLGYLKTPVDHHFQLIPDPSVEFAKQWGMNVAVQDLRVVISAARALGGQVVLGGHSLGGAVVTAYATWDFDGRPGADQLAGLVYIDGGSGPAETAPMAEAALQALDGPTASPWLSFGGIPAPYAGIFNATGSAAALLDPNAPSLGQPSGIVPADLVPKVPVTNAAEYGYALNAKTSPPSLLAVQAHLGAGISSRTLAGHHLWNGAGALTPLARYATMFSGYPMQNVDGTEWYFPQRLADDTGAVDNGNANPAQQVLDVDATLGHQLPKRLFIYAFGARLGGPEVLAAARGLAAQSGIPTSHLTLINHQSTYSHNDPAGAYPRNDFFVGLMPFLGRVTSARAG